MIIADKECAITSGRRLRAERAAVVRERGHLPELTRYNIVQETCENCRECTTATGCPGLELVRTPLGEKVGISDDVCVDDGYCARIKACPSFERVTVRRSRAPASAVPDLTPPPEPVLGPRPAVCRVHLSGVGGMGIGVVGRILIEAAAEEWPAVEVYHRKGLAQRGGGVFSHVTMHDGAVPRPAEIPEGAADVILGLEPLEAARALRLASPERTAAAVDTHRRPTTNVLTGAARYPDDLVERANAETRPGALVATDFTAAAKAALGDTLYANVAVLGAAWQRGWIPVGREALEGAIRRVAGGRAEANLRAFLLGRVLAAGEARRDAPEDAEALIARELGWVRGRRRRRAVARAFERARAAGLGEVAMRMLAPRLPEIVAWGGAGYAERYLAQIDRVRRAAPALIPAAIHNLHRTMAIKDEVFVAYQLTSGKKYARDRERFGVDRSRGDRISYVHLNRPAFDVLGRRFEWDMETRDWQLRLMRGARVPAPAAAALARARARLPRLVRGRGRRRRLRRPPERRRRRGGAAPAGGRHRLPRGALPQGGRRPRPPRRAARGPCDEDPGGRRRRVVRAGGARGRRGLRPARDRGGPLDGRGTGRRRHALPALPERRLRDAGRPAPGRGHDPEGRGRRPAGGRGQGRDRGRPGAAALAGALARVRAGRRPLRRRLRHGRGRRDLRRRHGGPAPAHAARARPPGRPGRRLGRRPLAADRARGGRRRPRRLGGGGGARGAARRAGGGAGHRQGRGRGGGPAGGRGGAPVGLRRRPGAGRGGGPVDGRGRDRPGRRADLALRRAGALRAGRRPAPGDGAGAALPLGGGLGQQPALRRRGRRPAGRARHRLRPGLHRQRGRPDGGGRAAQRLGSGTGSPPASTGSAPWSRS